MTKYLLLAFAFSTAFSAIDIDNEENLLGSSLKTWKLDGDRFYKITRTHVFNHPFKKTLKLITNFEEKCNNDFLEKRTLLDKKRKCLFKNRNLIESYVTKVKKKGLSADLKKYNSVFTVTRRSFSRDEIWSHTDLGTIKKEKGKATISLKMLDQSEIEKFHKPFAPYKSVFKSANGTFNVKKLDKDKTQVTYTYIASTDHWLLNKTLASPKVFEAMANGVDLLFKSINGSDTPQIKRPVKVVH